MKALSQLNEQQSPLLIPASNFKKTEKNDIIIEKTIFQSRVLIQFFAWVICINSLVGEGFDPKSCQSVELQNSSNIF